MTWGGWFGINCSSAEAQFGTGRGIKYKMVPKATLFITPDHDTCRNSRDPNRECRIFVFIYKSLYHPYHHPDINLNGGKHDTCFQLNPHIVIPSDHPDIMGRKQCTTPDHDTCRNSRDQNRECRRRRQPILYLEHRTCNKTDWHWNVSRKTPILYCYYIINLTNLPLIWKQWWGVVVTLLEPSSPFSKTILL